MGVDGVTKNKVCEACAPNSDLASKEDLIKRVLAKEYAIEQVEEPEADCTEADKDKDELVCLGRHLVEVGILSLAPLRGKEKIQDNDECQV